MSTHDKEAATTFERFAINRSIANENLVGYGVLPSGNGDFWYCGRCGQYGTKKRIDKAINAAHHHAGKHSNVAIFSCLEEPAA